jgi:hypothetical protein
MRGIEALAQKTIIELIDDLDGSLATESVNFGLDGVEYTIDLSPSNAGALRATFEPYRARSQRQGGRKQRNSDVQVNSKEQNQAIRAWARKRGERISDRGRISADLVARFHKAHEG